MYDVRIAVLSINQYYFCDSYLYCILYECIHKELLLGDAVTVPENIENSFRKKKRTEGVVITDNL